MCPVLIYFPVLGLFELSSRRSRCRPLLHTMGSGSVLRVLLLSVLACALLLKAENPDEDGAPSGPRVAPVLQSKDGMWDVDFPGHDANVIPQPQVVSSGGIQMVAFLSQPQRENHNAIVFGRNPGAPLKLPKPWQSLLTQKSQTSDQERWQNSGSSRYRHWGPQPLSYSGGEQVKEENSAQQPSQSSESQEETHPQQPPSDNQELPFKYQTWGSITPTYQSGQVKYLNVGLLPSKPSSTKQNLAVNPDQEQLNNLELAIKYKPWGSDKPAFHSGQNVQLQPTSYSSGHKLNPQLVSASSSQTSSTLKHSLSVTPEQPLVNNQSIRYQAWGFQQPGYTSLHQFKPQNIGPHPSSGGLKVNVGETPSRSSVSNIRYQSWRLPNYISIHDKFKPTEVGPQLLSYQSGHQVRPQHLSLSSSQASSTDTPSLPVTPEPPLSNVASSVKYQAWESKQASYPSGHQFKPQSTGPQPSSGWLYVRHQNVGEQTSQPSSSKQHSSNDESNLRFQAWDSWKPSYSSGQHQFKPQEAQSVSNPSKLLVRQQNSDQLPCLASKPQDPQIPENSKQQTSYVVSPFGYVGQQQLSLPSGQQVRQENSGQKPSQHSGSPNRLPVSPEEPPLNTGHIVWGTWQPNVQSGKQFKPQITGPQPSNNWLQVMHQNVGEQPSQPSSPQEQNLPVTSEQSGSNLRYQGLGSWQPSYSSGQHQFKPQEAQSVSNLSKLLVRQQNSGQLPSLSSKPQDSLIPENSKQTSNVVSFGYVGWQQPSLPSGQQVRQEISGQKTSQHSGSPNILPVSPEQPPLNTGHIVRGSWQPNIQRGKQFKPQITGPQPSNNWLQVRHQNVGEQPSQPSSPQEQNLPVTSVQSGSNLGYQTWGSWKPSYSSGQHHIQKPNFGQQPNFPSGSQESPHSGSPGQQPSQNPEVPSVYQSWYSTGQHQVRYQNVGQPSSSSAAQEVSFAVTPEQQPSDNVVSNIRYQTWGSQGPSFQSGQPPFKPQGPQSASNQSRQVRPENWGHLPSQPSRPQEPNIPQSPDLQTSNNVSNIRYQPSRPKLPNYPSVQSQFKPPNVGLKPSIYPSGHKVRPQHLSLSSLASSTQKPSLPVTPEQLLSNLDSSVRYQAWGSNQPIYQSGQQSKPQQPNLQEVPDQKPSDLRYQAWWTSSPGRHQIQLQNSGQQPNLPSGSQKPDQPLSQTPGYQGWDSNKLSYPSGTHPVRYQNIGQPSRLSSRAQEVNLPVTSEQQPSNLKYQTWSSQQPSFLSGQNQVLFFSSSGLQQYKPQGPQVKPQNLGQSPSQLSRPLELHIPENPEQVPSNNAESRLRYQAWWSRQPSFPGKPQIGQQTPKPTLKVTDEQPPSSNPELSVGNQGLGSQQLNFQSGHQLRPQNVGEQPSQPSKSQRTHIPGNPEQQTSHNVVSNIRYQVWGTQQPNYPSRPYQLKPQEQQQSASNESRPQVRWQSSGQLPNVPSQPQESNIAVAPEHQPFNNVGSTIGYEAWRPKLPNYPSEQHQFKPPKVGPQPSSHSGVHQVTPHQLSLSSSLASNTQKPSLPETPEQQLANLESSKRNQVWWSIYQSGTQFKPQIIGPQSSGWLQVRHQNVGEQPSQPSVTLEENLPVAPEQPLSNNAKSNIRYQIWGSQVKHQNQGVPHGILSKLKESSVQVTPEQPPFQASTLLPRYQGWGSNQEVSTSVTPEPSDNAGYRFQVWGSQQPSYPSGHKFKPQIIGPQLIRWLNVKHPSVGQQTNPSSSTLERLPVTPEQRPSNAENNLRYQVLWSQQHLPSLHSRTGEPSLQEEPLRQHSALVTPQISAQHHRLPSRLLPQNSRFMTGPRPVQTPNPQNPAAQLQQGQQSSYRKPKQPSYPSMWHEQGGSAHLSSPPRPEQQGYVSKPQSQSYPKITVPPMGTDYVVSGKVFSRNQPQQSDNVGISQSLHPSQPSDSQNQPKVPLLKPAQQFQNTGVLPSRPKPSFPLPQVQNKPAVSPKPPYMSQNLTVGFLPRPQASYTDQPPSPTLPEQNSGVPSKPQTSFVHPQLSFQVHQQSQEKPLRPSQEYHSPEVVRTRGSYLFGQNKPPPPFQPQAGYSDSQLSILGALKGLNNQPSNPLPRPSQESQSPEAVHSQASYLLLQKQPAPLPRPSQHSQNSGILLSRLQANNTGSLFNYPRPLQPLRQNSGILPSTPQTSFVRPQFSFQVYQQSQNNPHTTPYQESQSSEVVHPQANFQLGQKKPSFSFPRPSQQSQTPVLQPQAGYSGSQLSFQARQQSQNNPSNPQESQITKAAHPQASYLLVQSQPHTGSQLNYLSSQLSQSLPAAPLSRLQQSQNSGVVFPKPLPSYPQNNLDSSPPSWSQSQSPNDALSSKPQVLRYRQSQSSKPVISPPKPQQPQVSLDGLWEQSQYNAEPSWLAQNPAVVFSGLPARYSHPQQSQNQPDSTNEVLSGKPQIYQLGTELFHWPGSPPRPPQQSQNQPADPLSRLQQSPGPEEPKAQASKTDLEQIVPLAKPQPSRSSRILVSSPPSGYPKLSQNQGGVPLRKPQLSHPASWQYHNSALLSRPYQSQGSRTLDPRWQPNYPLPQRSQNQHGGTLPRPTQWSQNQAIPFRRPNPGYPQHSLNSPKRPKLVPSRNYAGVALSQPPQLTSYTRRQPSYPQSSQPSFSYTSPQHASTGSKWFWYHPGFYSKPRIYKVPKTQSSQNSPGVLSRSQQGSRRSQSPPVNNPNVFSSRPYQSYPGPLSSHNRPEVNLQWPQTSNAGSEQLQNPNSGVGSQSRKPNVYQSWD